MSNIQNIYFKPYIRILILMHQFVHGNSSTMITIAIQGCCTSYLGCYKILKMILILKKLLDQTYYSKLSLPFTMNLHLLREKWWPIVCPISDMLIDKNKGVIPDKYVACCLHQPILVGKTGLPVVHFRLKSPQGLP